MPNVFMLKGQSLLDYHTEQMQFVQRGEKTRTEIILDAGYQYDNGKAMYTQYYTEVLNAQGNPPMTYSEEEVNAYDNLDSETKELYDAVDAQCGEKWDHDEMMEFIEELDDIGITTAEEFSDRFYGVFDTEKEFAEEYANNCGNVDTDSCYYFAIDWQAVWDHSLRYDYDYVEFDYTYFFFSKY